MASFGNLRPSSFGINRHRDESVLFRFCYRSNCFFITEAGKAKYRFIRKLSYNSSTIDYSSNNESFVTADDCIAIADRLIMQYDIVSVFNKIIESDTGTHVLDDDLGYIEYKQKGIQLSFNSYNYPLADDPGIKERLLSFTMALTAVFTLLQQGITISY